MYFRFLNIFNFTNEKNTNKFQIELLKEISKKNINKNVTISPLSIYHILSLTTNGAVNETLYEMLNTLCHKDLNEMNENNKAIASVFEKCSSVKMANAVFTKIKPLESFEQMASQYIAKIDKLKNVDQVNQWCSKATHGKISKILDSLNPDDVMFLINAIYFKGIWLKSFDKSKTEVDFFFNYSKDKIFTYFMMITDKFNYFHDDDVEAISLKYKHDNMVATIILPHMEIKNYIDNLTLDTYINLVKKMKEKKVTLHLPKFELRYNEELKESLISLGMVQAFKDTADFSSMIENGNGIKIEKVIHQSYIKVDEEGTEAAAATVVVKRKKSLNAHYRIIDMKVNRPFLFIIRNENLPCGEDIIFASKIEMLESKFM